MDTRVVPGEPFGLAVRVGVAHDVRAGLGDGQAHVLDHGVGQLQRLCKGAQHVPHDGDVLGPRGESQADVRAAACLFPLAEPGRGTIVVHQQGGSTHARTGPNRAAETR